VLRLKQQLHHVACFQQQLYRLMPTMPPSPDNGISTRNISEIKPVRPILSYVHDLANHVSEIPNNLKKQANNNTGKAR
jgi:hypothetical protein